MKSVELASAEGRDTTRERGLAYQALFQYGDYVAGLGNLAEAKNAYDEAEEGARVLLEENPGDTPTYDLILDIRAAKKRLGLR